MRISVLGAVEAHTDSGVVTPPGARSRGLLARLALDAGRPVAASTLVDDLWPDPPAGAANALHAQVSRLRRALGGTGIVTGTGGYRLTAEPADVDALAFEELVTSARRAPAGEAHAALGRALDLWRGPALDGLDELPFTAAAAARLTRRRGDAVEQRARLALRLGLPADLDALAALVAAEPLRETAAALLARGLHTAGRQADALAVLDRATAALADGLGVDPGPELAAARLEVLRTPATPRATGLTSFVGRDRDVARIAELLRAGRLVTLVGPGGAGKTRLAREVTEDAAVVVELAALTAPDQVPPAVLAAVGEPELRSLRRGEPEQDVATRLRAALAGRAALLVLDNCEHLVEAAAGLVADLLPACPLLRVLATSREPLAVPGEVLHPVEGLADADAAALFADRGAAVRPGFDADAEAGAVAEICRRLDGQPLAIELAAARLRTLTPIEIAARLDDRFRLLTTGARTALPRHQTLRAVVDWSWDLLAEPERAIARRLSVFAGGASIVAAERVCGPGTFDGLASLVDKSLVVAVPQPDASTRYRMLETIRAYAGERLDDAGERDEAEAAHAAVVVALVEAAEPHLRGRDQLGRLARLRAEIGEIDAALQRTDPVTAHRIAVGVAWAWQIGGRTQELRRMFATLPPLGPDADPALRALAAVHRAMAALTGGDPAACRRHADEALELVAGLPASRHPMLELVGPVDAVVAHRDDGPLRALAAATDDPWTRAIALQVLAFWAENSGDVTGLRALGHEARAAFAEAGDRFGLGMTAYSLGELESLAGDHAAAATAFDEATALATELGNEEDRLQFTVGRALVEARRGDVAAARAMLDRAAASRARAAAGGLVETARAQVERLGGDLAAAREQLAGVAEAAARSPEEFGMPQRVAYVALHHALVEIDAGDPAAARTWLGEASGPALESRDGPVVALVAEVAALLAHAEGDDDAAVELLALAAGRRGTLDRGSPDVLGLLAELGPDVEAAIAATPADDAVLKDFVAR